MSLYEKVCRLYTGEKRGFAEFAVQVSHQTDRHRCIYVARVDISENTMTRDSCPRSVGFESINVRGCQSRVLFLIASTKHRQALVPALSLNASDAKLKAHQ